MARTMKMLRVASLASQLAVAAARLVSRDSDSDSVSDLDSALYRRRALHSIAVLGNYLYIEGGEISSYIDGNMTTSDPSIALNTTLSIPLHKSWTNTTVTFSETEKEEPLPGNNLGLWIDDTNTTMYRWGGDGWSGSTDLAADVHIWAFEADGSGSGSWSMIKDTFDSIKSGASAAVASCGDTGFYVGGYGSNSADERLSDTIFPERVPLPGLVTYNMTDNSWANTSTTAMSPPYGTYNSGEAVCVAGFGSDNVVFTLSGDTSTRASAKRVDSTLIGFDNVTFYDAGRQEWYWQAATGDVPKAREEFCAVGVAGNGTYDIYIYGGEDRTTGTRSDIAVLTLPGFHWFTLNVTSPQRMRHACALVGKSQMLSLGGLTEEWDWASSDTWPQALGVFDLNEWAWSDKYDADADAYQAPDTIVEWYESGAMGDMTWSQDDVKTMFASSSIWPKASAGKSLSTSSDTSSDSDSDSDSSSSNSSHSNTGAIAGGTVGGVAGVALIAAAFFLWRRKRRAPPGSTAVPTEELDSKNLSPVQQRPEVAAHELSHDGQIPLEMPEGKDKRESHPVELP